MQIRIKKVLTQADIDNGPQEPTHRLTYWRKAWAWCEGNPRVFSTVAAAVALVAMFIGLIYILGGPVPVPTGGRG